MTPWARAMGVMSRARPMIALYGFRAIAGLVISYPAARTLAAFGPPSPDGDLLLFAPGGLHLIEALRLGGHALGAATESAAAVSIVLSAIGLLPLAAALVLIADPGGTSAGAASRAFTAWPPLLLLGGATVLAQAAVAVPSSVVLGQLSIALGSLANERSADLVVLGASLAVLCAVLVLGIVQDLARAAVVRLGLRPTSAAGLALRTLVRRPSAVLRGWLGPACLGVAVVGVTAWAVSVVDVSRPGAVRIAIVLALHQGAALALAGLRIRWLACASRLSAVQADRNAMAEGA